MWNTQGTGWDDSFNAWPRRLSAQDVLMVSTMPLVNSSELLVTGWACCGAGTETPCWWDSSGGGRSIRGPSISKLSILLASLFDVMKGALTWPVDALTPPLFGSNRTDWATLVSTADWNCRSSKLSKSPSSSSSGKRGRCCTFLWDCIMVWANLVQRFKSTSAASRRFDTKSS